MVDPVPPDYQYSSTVMEEFRITQAKLKGKSSKEAYQLDNLDSPSEGNTMTADAFYQQLGFETTKEQVSKLPEMTSNFPITILSSSDMGKNAPIKGDWHTLQKQWLNQNPESMILQAQGGSLFTIRSTKIDLQRTHEAGRYSNTILKRRQQASIRLSTHVHMRIKNQGYCFKPGLSFLESCTNQILGR